jgi:hypothetical protein
MFCVVNKGVCHIFPYVRQCDDDDDDDDDEVCMKDSRTILGIPARREHGDCPTPSHGWAVRLEGFVLYHLMMQQHGQSFHLSHQVSKHT